MTREEEIKQAANENATCAILDYIDGALWADEHPKSPWISVEERLPEKNCKVMVAGGEYDIAIYRAASHKFYTAYKELQKKIGEKSDVGSYMIGGDCMKIEEYFSRGEREDITETVTHWMPILELPKGE